ncbi:DUF4197 domain-containing protein [Flavobacterium cerinum]|uniref:DUF4197 domain-containing protein n=1 Tax=Flavobacterium cerinum TaxID=2502784 RepID=A0ABY5IPW7_9FLAO|nr:DUF4197 domain-containing protein [Flavobacterium cerinum]UUC43818.1 DUF4197 domain-containing protein [Flavobacterium cerinum]
MKKIILLLALLPLSHSADAQLLKKLTDKIQSTTKTKTQNSGLLSQTDIASGLKEALNKGIEKQVVKLTQVDGFYKNEMVKILMPEELQKVDKTLRSMGMGSLADEGLKMMNRAAEDAVKEATPIFVNAIKGMTFTDAKNILLGNETAATSYLQTSTSTALYAKFNPVIKNSFEKVGADKVWSGIINKYNGIPLVKKVNPDLTDYVTNEAMEGVFKMISVEEKDIRGNLNSRSSDLLKKVFAMQDKK